MSEFADRAALTRVLATDLETPRVFVGPGSGEFTLVPGLYEFSGYLGSSYLAFGDQGATIPQDDDGHYIDCVRFVHGQTRLVRVDAADKNNLIYTIENSDDETTGAELRCVRLTYPQ